MALAGLILVCGGLVSAAFSNPPDALNDPEGDRQALLLGVCGFACTIAGTVLLVIVSRRTTESMSPEKKSRTNIGVGIGVILQLTALLVSRIGAGPPLVVPLLLLVSVPVFVWGCMNYAEGKGRSKWLGLVGVAGIIGLAVLTIFPEQHEGDGVNPPDPDPDAAAEDVASQAPEI
jgi:drug/metabolite transporter (DMT)-like permease